MMQSLQWNKLNDRWYNHMITMILNCMKGKAPEYLSSQFIFMSNIHSKGTRSQSTNCLYEPKWNIGAGNRTFNSRAVKMWNNLPVNIRCNYADYSVNQLKQLCIIKCS